MGHPRTGIGFQNEYFKLSKNWWLKWRLKWYLKLWFKWRIPFWNFTYSYFCFWRVFQVWWCWSCTTTPKINFTNHTIAYLLYSFDILKKNFWRSKNLQILKRINWLSLSFENITQVKIFNAILLRLNTVELHYWWRMLETECVGDNFKMLVTVKAILVTNVLYFLS